VIEEYVTDTHALVWHAIASPRLTPPAKGCFERADSGGARIRIPTIVLVELVYLSERGRVQTWLPARVLALLDAPNASYLVAPLDRNVAQAVAQVPRQAVPEMPDRIITATALSLGFPLVSADAKIQAAGVVPVIW
jgi:PIN domain nuclease of toxin-antitoxin system